MKTKLYFAYGANMHPKSMQHRCPNSTPVKQFDLRGWELKFYNHATVVPNQSAQVPGVLWTVTDDCEYNLDCFEGYPTYYTKKTWIQDDVEFFFYEMTPEMSSGIPGYLYVSDMVASYKHWNIPGDTLEAVAYANHVRQKTYTF